MWYKDKNSTLRRRKPNRHRKSGRGSILTVNARMVEQRKQRTHRMGAITLLVISVAVLGYLLVSGVRALGRTLFTENSLFTVTTLNLSSDGKLQPRHIREYGQLEEGVNLFALDIDRVRKDLESVPVVNDVQIERKLPDTLAVRITERVAIARLGKDDRRFHLAVDREGHVLGPSSRTPDLPALVGIREHGLRPGSFISDILARDALVVLDLCDTTRVGQRVKVVSIDVRSPEYLDVRLLHGERIIMGRDDVGWRLKQLVKILQDSAEKGKRVGTADLTVDKNFPVRYL